MPFGLGDQNFYVLLSQFGNGMDLCLSMRPRLPLLLSFLAYGSFMLLRLGS